MEPEIIADIKKDYLLGLLKEGKRPDGRGFNDYRPISVETGVSKKAEGSALVKIGNTQVMVGIKLTLGEPFPDMPESGVLTTNAELRPLASPSFEKGPPDEETVEIARVVDRGLRESKCMDLDKLCITPDELVWIVFVDIHALDYDGNLFDASTLGAIAALRNTYMPKVEGDKIKYGELTKEKLPVHSKPVETTFAKLGDSIVLDPILDEELSMDARITVATDEKGDICAMQKGFPGKFKPEEVMDVVHRAMEKGNELRGYFK